METDEQRTIRELGNELKELAARYQLSRETIEGVLARLNTVPPRWMLPSVKQAREMCIRALRDKVK